MSKQNKSRNHYRRLVQGHYRREAKSEGEALTSTMRDQVTRRLEIDRLLHYLPDEAACLEVGCGNGAATLEIAGQRRLSITAIDASPALIALAKKRSRQGVPGAVTFTHADVLTFAPAARFDVVYTERCIINLMHSADQKRALQAMARLLKPGGRMLLLEAFEEGNTLLNQARADIGLEPIPPAYHNLHLQQKRVVAWMRAAKLRLVVDDNFLSSYYFGSRVLYPALARLGRRDCYYNNAFSAWFALLPPLGNYSHIKLLVFEKA